jgi:autotransporter family porin
LIEGALTATSVTVSTFGNSAHGAEAQQGSALTMQNGTVTTSGDGAHGLHAIGGGSVIKANNINISTSGDDLSPMLFNPLG